MKLLDKATPEVLGTFMFFSTVLAFVAYYFQTN